jgi:hypothetical protein
MCACWSIARNAPSVSSGLRRGARRDRGRKTESLPARRRWLLCASFHGGVAVAGACGTAPTLHPAAVTIGRMPRQPDGIWPGCQAAGANRRMGPTGCGNLVAPLGRHPPSTVFQASGEVSFPESVSVQEGVGRRAAVGARSTCPGNHQRRGRADSCPVPAGLRFQSERPTRGQLRYPGERSVGARVC